MGRTGKWSAYQHYGIQPDITTLAKPLAGRHPHRRDALHRRGRARIYARHAWDDLRREPLATGVAIAVIDTIKQSKLLAHVEELGNYFLDSCRDLAVEAHAS